MKLFFALQGALQSDQHVKLAFANSHVVNIAAANPGFSDALRQFMVLPDGVGVDLGSRLLCGVPFAANLNGTDFIPRLITSSSAPLKIGLVGAKPGVAERAMARLATIAPQHTYRTFGHGFFTNSEEPALLAELGADRPD
ncbi:MAG: WecB/TagA/CpsF family glycosyltransferase, partial [Bosea sp. (in: a-proteobacteria)]